MRIVGSWPALLAVACGLGCSGSDGAEQDAGQEQVCTPLTYRCDPEGTQMLERCSEDGALWEDFVQCELCHGSQCYGRLDGSTD